MSDWQFKDRENPKDPVVNKGSPDNGVELLKQMGKVCNGFTHEAVISAAMSLVINSIRQRCDTSKKAQNAFDELASRSKHLLMEQHYMPGDQGGRRRGIFPYTQNLAPSFMDFRDEAIIMGLGKKG